MERRTFINQNGVKATIENEYGWFYLTIWSQAGARVSQSRKIDFLMKILNDNGYIEQ